MLAKRKPSPPRVTGHIGCDMCDAGYGAHFNHGVGDLVPQERRALGDIVKRTAAGLSGPTRKQKRKA